MLDDSPSIGDRLLEPPGEKSIENASATATTTEGKSTVVTAVSASLTPQKHKVAVNAIFFARLGKILRIVIPTVYSQEMGYIIILTVLLFARTFFSIYIAELIGANAQSLVSRKW